MTMMDKDTSNLTQFQIKILNKLEESLRKKGLSASYQNHQVRPRNKSRFGECFIEIDIGESAMKIWLYDNEVGYEDANVEVFTFERVKGESDDSISEKFFNYILPKIEKASGSGTHNS